MVASLYIVILSAIALASSVQLINKLMINEKFVDESRAKMTKMQKDLKGVDIKSKHYQETQEKIIDMNLSMMKQQMKPMIFTFIPYIIGFWLLGAMFGFMVIGVGSDITFEVNGDATIVSECLDLNKTIDGKEKFTATVSSENCSMMIDGKEMDITLIGAEAPIELKTDNAKIVISPPKQVILELPFEIPYVGSKLGWLGTFIIFSFSTSMILSKALKGKYLRKWE